MKQLPSPHGERRDGDPSPSVEVGLAMGTTPEAARAAEPLGRPRGLKKYVRAAFARLVTQASVAPETAEFASRETDDAVGDPLLEDFSIDESDEPFYMPEGRDPFPGWLRRQITARRDAGERVAQWYAGTPGPDVEDVLTAQGDRKREIDEVIREQRERHKEQYPDLYS